MREMLNNEAKSTNPTTGDLAVAMVSGKFAQLEAVDSTAGLEFALVHALASGPGAERLRGEVLLCLPTESRQVDIAKAIGEIEASMGRTLHAFASRPAKGMVAENWACLRSIARGYPPCFTSWGEDVVLKKVRDEILPNFIKHEHLVEKEGEFEAKEF